MVALTKDRNTSERAGHDAAHPIAANVICFAGGMGAVNAAGNAVPASNTAGLKVVGCIVKHIDNTGGLAGTMSVPMKRGVFHYANSTAAPLTAADVGGTALVEDDATVAKTATANIVAGKILNVDPTGVWVEIR